MKKAHFPAAFLFFSLVFGGCISFRIVPSYPLEGYVERILLCTSVDESGDLLEPLEVRNEFRNSDESVVCFIEVRNISRKIGMRWKWYAPDLSLSRDSGNVIINREEQLLEVVTAYDELMIGIREHEEKAGRWTVTVLVNDHLVASKTFEIKEPH